MCGVQSHFEIMAMSVRIPGTIGNASIQFPPPQMNFVLTEFIVLRAASKSSCCRGKPLSSVFEHGKWNSEYLLLDGRWWVVKSHGEVFFRLSRSDWNQKDSLRMCAGFGRNMTRNWCLFHVCSL